MLCLGLTLAFCFVLGTWWKSSEWIIFVLFVHVCPHRIVKQCFSQTLEITPVHPAVRLSVSRFRVVSDSHVILVHYSSSCCSFPRANEAIRKATEEGNCHRRMSVRSAHFKFTQEQKRSPLRNLPLYRRHAWQTVLHAFIWHLYRTHLLSANYSQDKFMFVPISYFTQMQKTTYWMICDR